MLENNNLLTNDLALLQEPKGVVKLMQKLLADENIQSSNNKYVAGRFILSERKAVVGLSIVEFFNIAFPQSEHFVITAIKISYGAGAAPPVIDFVPGISDATVRGNNGRFAFDNNGVLNLKDIPLAAFPVGGSAYPNAGFLPLDRPIIVKGADKFTLRCQWDTAPITANAALEVQLWGIKLI